MTDIPFVHDTCIQEATAFIEECFASSLTPADVAAAACTGTATLNNLFKKTFGMTVMQYVMHIRLEYAATLLCSTSFPIKDIAARCGFKTVPHFNRLFKEKHGMPPAKYRAAKAVGHKPPMLDVVFELFTQNGIEYNNPGLIESLITIGFTLCQGPIDRLDSEERYACIDRMIYKEFVMQKEVEHSVVPFEKAYLHNLELLRSHAAKGYPVRIWCALAHAEPLCEFAFLCDVLSEYDCPVYVIEHPDEKASCFGYHDGDFAPFLERTKPLAREEMEAWAALWRRLKEENAPLRVREDGCLRSAPIDYYDDRLTRWLPTAWGEIVCAEQVACRPNCYGDRDMPPAWYTLRLQTFIEEGRFAMVPVIGETERTMIRHPDATPPVTMEDLLRIACACCPPAFDCPKHLPMPQVWVLLAVSGRIYCVKNDDISMLLTLLKEHGDTVIAQWVTFWCAPSDILPPVDVPSFEARQALLELDNANSQTLLLLRGENGLVEKALGDTML